MDFISFHDMPHNTDLPLKRRHGKEKAQVDPVQVIFPKGPKRKRLAKACDACHKSKRRCDGTAPCSNCSFASKECSYTDASGRPVPAPKASKRISERPKEIRKAPHDPHPVLPVPTPTSNMLIKPSFRLSPQDNTSITGQKRHRTDSDIGQRIAELSWYHPVLSGRPAGIELKIIRELVNLFFAHCYPHRFIIHEPSFMAALSRNEIPQSLIFAICANAAPFSRSPRIRSASPRLAGLQFCREAVNLMFDATATLICAPDLATVQALCLLEMHEIGAQYSWTKYFRYHEVAITILFETLQVHKPDLPSSAPKEYSAFIERECIRRCFWLIFVADVICTCATRNPQRFPSDDIAIQLPIDETAFEFGIQDRVPEYLTLPAPKCKYASEFGHLARIVSISCRQQDVAGVDDDTELDELIEVERRLNMWRNSLPDHLQFTEENLRIHESMFESGSGNIAYCFYFAHLADVCRALITKARDKRCDANLPEYVRARDVLFQIVNSIGPRVKNLNWILGPILWGLSTYFRDDAYVRELDAAFESMWGYKSMEIAQTWREHNRVMKKRAQIKPVIMSRSQRVLESSKIYIPNIYGMNFMADGRMWEYDKWQRGVRPKPHGNIVKMRVDAEDGDGRRDDNGLRLPSLKAVGLLGDLSYERAMPSGSRQNLLPSLSISTRD